MAHPLTHTYNLGIRQHVIRSTAARSGRQNVATENPTPISCDATRTLPRIFLRVARDGTHVELDVHAPFDAIECSRRAHQYLDVGRDGDA